MRAVGIICEYNPFHNGHALHLAKARQAAVADFVVCLMSGCFTQRGEPALFSPWVRAEMALRNGADVVLELPCLWATGHAERFARGGVSILHALGVPAISFGVECNPDTLFQTHRLLRDEARYKPALDAFLAKGHSFPKARSLAIEAATGQPLPSLPNLSLAFEYLSAIQDFAPEMQVYPVLREGEGYHSTSLAPLASASGIRAALVQEKPALSAIQPSMPPEAYAVLQNAYQQGAFVAPEALDQAMLYALRAADASELAALDGFGEGVEQRFLWEAQYATNRVSLLARVKSKRYPYARLSRLLLYALLRISRTLPVASPEPPYVRLLGMRRSAGSLLRHWKQNARIPVITHGSDSRLRGQECWALDVRAADIWSLGLSSPEQRNGGQMFAAPPIIL